MNQENLLVSAPFEETCLRGRQERGEQSHCDVSAVRVFTLGRFSLLRDGVPICFSHKTPKRPVSLLKALVALGGREVSGRKLTDALWPDEEGDAADCVLRVNVYRLRRLLGARDVVIVYDNHVSLESKLCWVDVWEFQRLLGEAAAATSLAERADLLERALALYKGAFLPGDADEPWSLSMRERLRNAFLRLSAELGRLYESTGRWDKAIECHRRGIESDELAEESYQGIMRCYWQMDRRAEGVSVYRRLRQTLSIVLGISPSSATEQLLQQLLSSPPLHPIARQVSNYK